MMMMMMTQPFTHPPLTNKRYLVTGGSGLVGSQLITALAQAGATVIQLLHKPVGTKHPLASEVLSINWQHPQPHQLDRLEGLDGVVHLAGESIMGLWTPEKRQAIYQSRVEGTRQLVEGLLSLAKPPQVLVSASAVGYYGDAGNALLTEDNPKGFQFLSAVCDAWEQATQLAQHAGFRTVQARFGVVLSHKGGALKAMLPAFNLGVGGCLGNGKPLMSWVDLDDAVALLIHALTTPMLSGAINVVAPNPVNNGQFTQTLAKTLGRLAVLPVPAWLLKALLGQLATELLLSSQNAYPQKALDTGFEFKYPTLEACLKHQLKDPLENA
jgi:uncharacterized protein